MNTVQLECFMTVAEYLNFSKAADFLKITQPAVSHQINSLEDELGTKLFKRTSKSVSLTHAGFLFLEDASSILKIAASAKNKLSAGGEEFPLLNIGCHNQSELDLVPPILAQLIRKFPALHPSVKQIPFKSMANLLEEERIHVMFGFRHEEQKKAIGIYHELCRCPIACVCHREHPYADRASLNLNELTGAMVLCDPHKLPAPIFQIQMRASTSLLPSELFFADGYESALALVKSGIGFTLLPRYPDIRDDELCYIPISGPELLHFGVYYKSLAGNAVLKEFLRLLDIKLKMTPCPEP